MRDNNSKISVFVEYSVAFLLPSLLLLSVLAVFGVYPFGEKTLLVADMHSEYIHYFTYFHRAIRGEGSFLRSWEMGMGLNMLGLTAFYCASPFNLILYLLPERWIMESVFLVTILKIGACGLIFHIMAKSMFNLRFITRLTFSTAYAMIGYVIYYSSNIMWLDGVAFLPLAVLGVDRMIRHKKTGLLLGSLIYIFWSSYYIGYMIGIFLFLYHTACIINEGFSIRAYLSGCRRLIVTAALAAGCCGILLLPAFLNLRQGQMEMWDMALPTELSYIPTELGYKLIPGVFDTLMDAGRPNVYFSLFGVWMLILYFLNRDISRREKICFGSLLAGLLVSMCSSLLDLAWHAFESPTWYPARYSFLFAFLCLFMGMRCAEHRSALGKEKYFASALVALIFLAEALFLQKKEDGVLLLLVFFLLFAYAILHGRNSSRIAVSALLLILLSGELWYNAYQIFDGIDSQLHYRSRQSQLADREKYESALTLLPDETLPFRTERASMQSANHSLSLGYRPVSHYSTTTDQRLNGFLARLGQNMGTLNELRFSPGSAAVSGLLGVKYLLSDQQLYGAYKRIESTGKVEVYENTLAYPLAYFAEYAAESLHGDSPFAIANQWNASLTGSNTPLFHPMSADFAAINVSHRTTSNGAQVYTKLDHGKEASITWTIENPDENEVYLWFDLRDCMFSRVTASVNQKSCERILAYRNNPIVPLGDDKVISFTAIFDEKSLSFREVYCFSLNGDAAWEGARQAQERQMQFSVFEDTKVEGEMLAPGPGYAATTFPYDKGWSVTVNGRKVPIRRYAEAFLAIPVEEGRNTISMRYWPRGFRAGCGITAVSICLLFFARYSRRFRKSTGQ